MENCIFCAIAAGQIPSCKIYEDDLAMAFLDVNPMSKSHTLIIPKGHWRNLSDFPMPSKEYCAVMRLVRAVAKAAMNTFAQGANILQCNEECGGQTVFHLHFHVIPRFEGGPVPPTFESGAGKYESEEERDHYAELLRAEVPRVLASMNLPK